MKQNSNLAVSVQNVAIPRTIASTRIPQLDGLRALAVGLVVFGHAILTSRLSEMPVWESASVLLVSGTYGVQIFFVISGFIITRLLLEELRISGRIHFGAFYAKRFAKLVPPVIALVVCALLYRSLQGHNEVSFQCAAAAVTFTVGFFPICDWTLSHLWTLTLEEIFYLFWPMLLFYTSLRKARFWWVVSLVGFGIACRILTVLTDVGDNVFGTLQFLDHMGFGAAIAIWMTRTSSSDRLRRLLSHPLTLAVGLVSVAPIAYISHYSPVVAVSLVGQAIKGAAFSLLVIHVLDRDSVLTRILKHRFFAYVGVCSYSIYLFQQLMYTSPTVLTWLRTGVWAVLAHSFGVVGVGIAMFHLIERPAQKWLRAKLLPVTQR